jgi:hypothetical protein
LRKLNGQEKSSESFEKKKTDYSLIEKPAETLVFYHFSERIA